MHQYLERKNSMDNDKLLSSLSKHIAYWYTTIKGEKDILFPINNVIKEKANQLFKDRYHDANIIVSENGEIYKISKEICCESNMWSYVYYLDDMKKNYRLKKICKEILPYDLKADNSEKINILKQMQIPSKIVSFKINKNKIENIKEKITPYLKCYTYIDSKQRKIIAYPDVLTVKNNRIIIFLNYYHHHHMDRHIKKISKVISKEEKIDITVK